MRDKHVIVTGVMLAVVILIIISSTASAETSGVFSVGSYSLGRLENFYGELESYSFDVHFHLLEPEKLASITLEDPQGDVLFSGSEPDLLSEDGLASLFSGLGTEIPSFGDYTLTVDTVDGMIQSEQLPTDESSLSSTTPVILSPVDSEMISDPTPTFSWEPFESPEREPGEITTYMVEVFAPNADIEGDDVTWRAILPSDVTSVIYNYNGNAYSGFERLPPDDYVLFVFAFEHDGRYTRTSIRTSDFTLGHAVDIDILPDSSGNELNCSGSGTLIPVAILTTPEFDALTVDHTTVSFEAAHEVHTHRKSGEPIRHEEDVDGDGDTDLLFHFALGDTNLACDSMEATLTGATFEGHAILGVDSVHMVSNEGSGTNVFAVGLSGPFGMAFATDRDLLVANEGNGGGGTEVSRVTPSGRVTTFVTGLNGPSGVAFDSSGVLYVSDDTNRVLRVSQTGEVEVFVDADVGLENPNAIAFDSNDNLYVVSTAGFVSKFDANGTLVNLTLASGFFVPQSVVVDEAQQVLYISDAVTGVYQVDMHTGETDLLVETFVHTQGGLAMDRSGNLYLSAWDAGEILRIDAKDRTVSTCISGVNTPRGLAFDDAGRLYVTAYNDGEILRTKSASHKAICQEFASRDG